MKTWLRKLNAALGLASIGGAVGLAVGGAWGLATGLLSGAAPLYEALVWGGVWGFAGWVAGGGFGAFLGTLGAGRSLENISWARVMLWGAIGGAAFPVFFSFLLDGLELGRVDFLLTAICAGLGSALSTAFVSVARGAERRELSAPEGDQPWLKA